MENKRLGVIEGEFADLVWDKAPIPMTDLLKECEQKFAWKRTTTYTVLKRLSEKGLFENKDGVVDVKMTREDFYAVQSERFVQETFGGSLPSFLAAFTAKKKLSKEVIEEIKRIIEMEEE